MKSQLQKEHTNGKYLIIATLITASVTGVGYIINKSSSPSSTEAVIIKGNNTNSPVAHDVQTQNNYYALPDTMKKVLPTVETKQQSPIIKVVYKEKASTLKVDSTPIKVNVTNSNVSIGNTGTLNQTTIVNPKPKPRDLSEEDVVRLKTIPKDYKLELTYGFNQKECQSYASQIANALTTLGYSYEHSGYGILVRNNYHERFEIEIIRELKQATVLVYYLQND